MGRGASLSELLIALAVIGLTTAIGLPRARGWVDRLAVDRAARDVTVALAVARHAAVLRATRARAAVTADSLLIAQWEGGEWRPLQSWPGPRHHGVALEVTNPVVVFGPTGLGWGASNTRVVMRRGSHVETITVSRVGRVKRW